MAIYQQTEIIGNMRQKEADDWDIIPDNGGSIKISVIFKKL